MSVWLKATIKLGHEQLPSMEKTTSVEAADQN